MITQGNATPGCASLGVAPLRDAPLRHASLRNDCPAALRCATHSFVSPLVATRFPASNR